MLRVCILFSLLALSAATTFKNSVVLTSADINLNVQTQVPGIYNSVYYRIYATHASGFPDSYAQKVYIQDTNNVNFTLSQLAQPLPSTGYILSETNKMRAPLTIYDGNAANDRVPFTFYIVDWLMDTYPVASAQMTTSKIDSQVGYEAAGVTVLSAEKSFTMYNFDIGSLSNVYFSSVGFDEYSSDYRFMHIGSSSQAKISFLTMYGPIVTLFNSNMVFSRFQFQFMKNTKYDYTLSPGATFALLSPGYLSSYASYKIPYATIPEAYNQAFTWGDSNWINADIQVRNVNPSTLTLRFTSSGGDNRDYISTSDESLSHIQAFGNRLSLIVNQNGNTNLKFLYQITGETSTAPSTIESSTQSSEWTTSITGETRSSLSFSLLAALLVAVFKFH